MTVIQTPQGPQDVPDYHRGLGLADDESLGRNRNRRARHPAVPEDGDPSEGDAPVQPVRPHA